MFALLDTVDPDVFERDDEASLLRNMSPPGAAFGGIDGSELVVYGMLTVHGDTADFDGSAVHPSYRGQGFQRRVSELRESYARELGIHRIAMTVSPFNPHSLRNHVNHGGFTVYALELKYGGKWRFLLRKELEFTPQYEPADIRRLDDIAGNRDMVSRGLVGIRVDFANGVWTLVYGQAPSAPR